MFKNLPTEVLLFSMLPVIIIIFADLIAFLVTLKKEKGFQFNYFIKISLLVANAFVLPLIGGYTIWIFTKYIDEGILLDNILYVSLLVFLWLCLFVLLIWVYMKSRRELREDEQSLNEVDNDDNEENQN